MLALMLMLPVQVDHLKRSGIGKVVMGLINCKEVGGPRRPLRRRPLDFFFFSSTFERFFGLFRV